MGFLQSLKDVLDSATAAVTAQASRIKNQAFADACMATCALVAAADGTIDDDEIAATADAISHLDALQHFDVSKLQTTFEGFCTKLKSSAAFGKIDCQKAITKLKGKDAEARACVMVGEIIGAADGNFDPDEKKVVHSICNWLGLNPTEFDV
jgi:tellurite resistance protein TerB